MQQEQHGRHMRYAEPAWLSRLFTRKSRNNLRLNTVSSNDTESSSAPLTAPLQGTECASPKLNKKKSRRRLSFVPWRGEEATKATVNNKASTRKATISTAAATAATPRAYVPKHAGSDFGKVAIPTTYRDSLVILYNGNSLNKPQYQRHSQAITSRSSSHSAGTLVTSGSASDLDRKRLSVINNPFADDSNDTLEEKVLAKNSEIVPERRHNSDPGHSRYSELRHLPRLSRKPLVVPAVVLCDADDENEAHVVTEPTVEEAKVNERQQNNSEFLTKSMTVVEKRHTTLGHNSQTPRFATNLLPSSASDSFPTGHRGSFNSTRVERRKGKLVSTANSGKNKRYSVIVNLGVKVTEYIKPTAMPDNSVLVVPQISVIRSVL
ncbi:hypothetical protein SEUCBS139899_007452 [Sporothrix eucalyptigena]|uniref:Uncharacterized protein n=1 Tax=Sporothrix eucalyptigena TaxID=1812306 RepID=A0ABP0B9P6_9PEZI